MTRSRITTLPISGAAPLALIVLVILALGASFSQAAITHPYTGTSFGPGGVGSGSFGNVQGVTVDQRNGDVFVYDDSEGGRVYKFDAAGAPVTFSSTGTNVIEGFGGAGDAEEEIAVDSSSGPDAGDIYVANNRVVRIYAESGAPLGELNGGEMCGVAVDPSGNVYVGIYPETARRYSPTTNPVTDADESGSMGGLSGVCNVAADGAGDLYAATYAGGVRKYEALQFGSLSASGTLVEERGRTLAVDGASGEVFIDEVERLSQYDGSVEPPAFRGVSGATGEGQLSGSFGVGVDHESGKLYIGDRAQVEVFGTAVAVPSVKTEAANGVSQTEATLNGIVEPAGTEVTSCSFEYGAREGSLTQTAPCEPAAPYTGNGAIEVSAHLTGLIAGSVYHYRITVTGSHGEIFGEDVAFHTPGPPAVEAEGLVNTTRTTALLRGVVAPHGLETEIWIEYGSTPAYGQASSHKTIGAGLDESEEYTQIEGLERGTIYHYRVVAHNEDGTAYGPDQLLATFGIASIGEELPFEVHATSARLRTDVETLGLESTYHYEYGTTNAYGSLTPTAPLGGRAEAELTGLVASTEYHFRLVVENSEGTVRGPDATFRTSPQTAEHVALPDGRGYEKVSPNANADGNVYQDSPSVFIPLGGQTNLPFAIAPTGVSVAYVADPPEKGGAGHEGTDEGNEYIATRTDAGWHSTDIVPPPVGFTDYPYYQGFSDDLSVGFGIANGRPFLRSGSSGSDEPLLTAQPPHRSGAEFTVAFAGTTPDLSHVLFAANDALTPGAVAGSRESDSLYDWSGGALALVSVLPDGAATANATFGGPSPTSIYGKGENTPSLEHAISTSGNRIFWTDLETNDLYVRENDTAPQSPVVGGQCTVAVDACTELVAEEAQFWGANPEGTRALYTKAGDLYEYDPETGQSTDVAHGANVRGVVGTSEDLSYIYLVAEGALAPGATSHRCREESHASQQEERGELPLTVGCNLFVLHTGEEPRPIAVLAPLDGESRLQSHFGTKDGDWVPGMGNKEAQVTPDGTHLLFESSRNLTGFAGDRTEQIYLYDDSSAALRCVSCSATGQSAGKWQAPGGGENTELSAFLTVSDQATRSTRWMSDDGDRIFFGTTEALVPQDTNGMPDVYEWERDGTGTCGDSSGCVYLISDGGSHEGSYLVGTTTTGDDVFFTTRGTLVSEDGNEQIDLYDARVGATPPVVPSSCIGTGCQGVPATTPTFATPPSETYNGVGNLTPPAGKGPVANPKSKPLTRAQKLARALKACRRTAKNRRVRCRAEAHRRFGAQKKANRAAARRSNASKGAK